MTLLVSRSFLLFISGSLSLRLLFMSKATVMAQNYNSNSNYNSNFNMNNNSSQYGRQQQQQQTGNNDLRETATSMVRERVWRDTSNEQIICLPFNGLSLCDTTFLCKNIDQLDKRLYSNNYALVRFYNSYEGPAQRLYDGNVKMFFGQLSNFGIAPQIYAYLDTPLGRIEEFFEAKDRFTLISEKLRDPLYERDILRTVAKVNALPVAPGATNAFFLLVTYFLDFIENHVIRYACNLARDQGNAGGSGAGGFGNAATRATLEELLSYDLRAEADWIYGKISSIPSTYNLNLVELPYISRVSVRTSTGRRWPYVATDWCVAGSGYRGFDVADLLQGQWYDTDERRFPYYKVQRPLNLTVEFHRQRPLIREWSEEFNANNGFPQLFKSGQDNLSKDIFLLRQAASFFRALHFLHNAFRHEPIVDYVELAKDNLFDYFLLGHATVDLQIVKDLPYREYNPVNSTLFRSSFVPYKELIDRTSNATRMSVVHKARSLRSLCQGNANNNGNSNGNNNNQFNGNANNNFPQSNAAQSNNMQNNRQPY